MSDKPTATATKSPAAAASPPGKSPEELDVVRGEVRKLLEQSPAFAQLDGDAKRRFANDMVRVGSYLADPAWLERAPAEPVRGLNETDPISDLKGRLAQKPGAVQSDFKASAVREGVDQFGAMVDTVDFPAFVSGLIQGVFQSIVDASIQQMRAYSELMAATAKSVDQFARDHITDAQARDFVRNRFPSLVQLSPGEDGGAPRLSISEDAEDTSELAKLVGTTSVDLSDSEQEQKFVNAARLEMARSRQQTMALMVLLGINRIVVTNGRINAKVVFDMKASDVAKRRAEAELYDRQQSESGGGMTYVAPWGGGGGYDMQSHVTTVRSSVDDLSESKAQVKAQLAGDVRVNFKSETFPLEKLLEPGAIQLLTQVAQPGRGVQTQAPATGAAPAIPGASA